MKIALFVSLISMAITGCAVPPQSQPVPRMAFPESEYTLLPKTGTATVKGQAFLKTRGGDVKTAAGNVVVLNPVTSYSIEWYEKSYLPNRRMEAPDPRLNVYMPSQTADGSGRFVFKNVPVGEYFVSTVVAWEAGSGYRSAMEIQGGAVAKRIKVGAGEEIEVIVTR